MSIGFSLKLFHSLGERKSPLTCFSENVLGLAARELHLIGFILSFQQNRKAKSTSTHLYNNNKTPPLLYSIQNSSYLQILFPKNHSP